jgi:O-antigen ligase
MAMFQQAKPLDSAINRYAGDFRWEPIIYLYCLYIGIIVAGDLAGLHGASSLGAAMFLVCLFVLYWRYLLNIKLSLIFFAILLSIACSMIPLVSLDENTMQKAYQGLIKYYALDCVLLVGLALPLTPLARARRIKLLYFTILVFLISGWLLMPHHVSTPDMVKPVMGVQGFLANGNNFALTAMLLLFLVDEKRSEKIYFSLHVALVLFLIYLSHTSGAILGFLVGMFYRFIYRQSKIPIMARWTVIAACIGLTIIIFVSLPPNTLEAVDTTNAKVKLAVNNINRVLSGNKIDFYDMIQKNGHDVTSGVWRLYHWNRILHKVQNSSLDEVLFGHGIGTIESMYGIEAHNDYIRFIFQTGIIGFLLTLFIWAALYRRMEEQYRWIVVMIACYCISENNYDNFVAMSLLALCMIGAKQRNRDKSPHTAVKQRANQETIIGESALMAQ